MDRTEFANLVLRLTPSIEAIARASGYRHIWQDIYAGELRFALVEAWQERPELLRLADGPLLLWCKRKAANAMERERAHETRADSLSALAEAEGGELDELADTATGERIGVTRPKRQRRATRYEDGPIGERVKRCPSDIDLTEEEWATLRYSIASWEHGVDPVDIDRLMQWLPLRHKQILLAILASFSGREIERDGHSYRQVVFVSDKLKELAAYSPS